MPAAIMAEPKYSVGDVVTYQDRQGRIQRGAVLGIDAHWTSWGKDEPLIIYRLQHPTYARNTFYTGEESVHHLA